MCWNVGTYAISSGHTLGAHTYKHEELTPMTAGAVRRDTLLAEEALRNVTKKRVKYMRPPFGRFSWSALEAMG